MTKKKEPVVIDIDEKTTSKLISLSTDMQIAQTRINDIVEVYTRAKGFDDSVDFKLSPDGKQLVENI